MLIISDVTLRFYLLITIRKWINLVSCDDYRLLSGRGFVAGSGGQLGRLVHLENAVNPLPGTTGSLKPQEEDAGPVLLA